MTATQARLPTVPAGVLRAVEKRYDVGTLEVRRPLEGGFANDVVLVDSDAGRFVLRIKYPPSDADGIAWEHRLVERLSRGLDEVVPPVRARDGSTFFRWRGDAVWLVPHVEGEPADPEEEAARLGNVVMLSGAATALVDWEEAHVGWLVFDLANGVWQFGSGKTADDFRRGRAARFVAAYREAGGPIPPAEDDWLAPLIRAKAVLELLRAPTDRHVDWEHQEHNLRSAELLA